MLDLSAFDGLVEAQEKGVEVDIKGPDGKPLDWRITVVGPDSARAKEFQRKMFGELRERETMDSLTAAEEEQYDRRRAAACTTAWSPAKLDGGDLPCSEANALTVYQRFPFIFEQVNLRVQGRASFMARSASGSAGRSETEATEDQPTSQP